MVALDVVVVIVVALLALLVAGLLRSNAELTRAMHQLGIDLSPDGGGAAGQGAAGVTTPVNITRSAGGARPTPARPDSADLIDLAGSTPAGEVISVAVTGVRHDTLLAFLTSGCSTCKVIWEAFRGGVDDVPGGARLVVVTRGPEGESPAAIAGLAGTRVPVVMSTEAWQHYDAPYAPYFIYVSGPEGRVTGEGVASSWAQVQGLLATAVADGSNPAPTLDVEQQWARAGGGAGATAGGTAHSGAGGGASSAARHDRIDEELSAAGIRPGDPRLQHTSLHEQPAVEGDRPQP
jgi:hypothetical protein